ncbi:Txe/YoeB family addiction module toxin [Cruoricaptor ignavus]|uniref:Txe/YoeB family addiction module toxin n=1 Tax=Cruoricaptor ignavus TaxID=1118202 RepID=UPI00370D3CFE
MEIKYVSKAEEDLNFWVKTGNKAILKKIAELTRAIIDDPFSGIGKPEALKHNLAPKWSRRINKEHRYVYLVENNTLYIYSLRGHYEKL